MRGNSKYDLPRPHVLDLGHATMRDDDYSASLSLGMADFEPGSSLKSNHGIVYTVDLTILNLP